MRRALLAISLFLAGCLCLARAQDMSLMGVGGSANSGSAPSISITTIYAARTIISSGSSLTTTADAPIGSTIIVFCLPQTANKSVTAVSESTGNTYSQAAQNTSASGFYSVAIYYSGNITHHLAIGGTITCTATVSYQAIVIDVSGLSSGLVDKANSATTTTTNCGISVASGTLGQAKEIVTAGMSSANAITSLVESSGFTTIFPAQNADGENTAREITSVTTSVTYAPSCTQASSNLVATIASFK